MVAQKAVEDLTSHPRKHTSQCRRSNLPTLYMVLMLGLHLKLKNVISRSILSCLPKGKQRCFGRVF